MKQKFVYILLTVITPWLSAATIFSFIIFNDFLHDQDYSGNTPLMNLLQSLSFIYCLCLLYTTILSGLQTITYSLLMRLVLQRQKRGPQFLAFASGTLGVVVYISACISWYFMTHSRPPVEYTNPILPLLFYALGMAIGVGVQRYCPMPSSSNTEKT